MTEDELARPLTAEDVGYWRKQVAERKVDPAEPWRDADVLVIVARFLATLDALRATPVADTAAPEGTRLVLMSEDLALELGASRVEWGEPDEHGWYTPTLYAVADTAGIDAAWREAEAALPEGWWLRGVWQWADPYEGAYWRAEAENFGPDAIGHEEQTGDTPAAALLALAAALRTPKPEGDR